MSDDELNASSEDRDQIILSIMDNDRKKVKHHNSHLGDLSVKDRVVTYWNETKKQRNRDSYWSDFRQIILNDAKISLVMCPAWGVIFPPYGIARLTGLLRNYGYKVDVYDINVAANIKLIAEHNVDYWESQSYFKWEEPVLSLIHI